jgi:hypothetical protein
MSPIARASNFKFRQKPLSRCLAVSLALGAPVPALAATTWTVNTCSEPSSGSGTTGSLRFAAANAASGDTIDMTGLTCGTISLTTGAIKFAQDDLTITGPGMNELYISGKYKDVIEPNRIIKHTGTGTLKITGLSMIFGELTSTTGSALGGCLYSAGYAKLYSVGTVACEASTTSGYSKGGGIYAKGGLLMKYSNLAYNTAYAGTSGKAAGGGATTPGNFTAKYSTISHNEASGASGNAAGFGGGLNLSGNVTISASTISDNSSGHNQGGIDIYSGSSASLEANITNSTISGNSAADFTGGVYVNSGTVEIENSTVVSNTAGQNRVGSTTPFIYYAPGVAIGKSATTAVTLNSALIANNTSTSGGEYDLSVPVRTATTVTISGANNLVRVTFAAVPPHTIGLSCPLLGPLRNNGGLTMTRALLSHSPGIDQGNNTAGLLEDQRGKFSDTSPYPYPRVSGSSADIGAYEVQQDDIIFNTSFEGCPLLE